ncbi:tyrosine-type recombinase/integrase [candidate division CSSED10-310 bacterium]|uniref:Tyrosine-type recombinase/integrase n=1 Tax=candidate division CSSED10-310 bacterium TaxID=2855610 RepID=A0ABV6YVW1_UNCC1
MKEYARQAGIKQRVTPHVFRHSFATEMYRHGVPLNDIRAMMGHDTKAETAVYIHVSDQVKKVRSD